MNAEPPADDAETAAQSPISAFDPADFGERRFLNRELSRLEFLDRVLRLARDQELPPLERVKFLAIVGSSLDEFFQIQVAGIKDRVVGGLGSSTTPDGLSALDQLRAIRVHVAELLESQTRTFLDEIAPALADAGIRFSDWQSLDDDDREYLVDQFEQRIFPVLTPLAVDPAHPFPDISSLSLNLAVIVLDPATGDRRFARVKVPPLLPRFVVMPDGERFVPLEQVIAAHLPSLFRGMSIECHFPFRVTRDADLMFEKDEGDDLLEAVEMELRRRRFGRAVRLEVDAKMSEELRELLLRELSLSPEDLYECDGPLDLAGLWAVYGVNRPDLKDDPWTPMTQPALATAEGDAVDLFGTLREQDVLVHHPYDSFTTSVEEFVKQAAVDPHVLAIKQTLYRAGGADSGILQGLADAALSGKQVVVIVELKARFDEEANIGWARALEDAGAHVVYGVVGLKTHAKLALVVRDEAGHIRRYCHIGTGNYNPTTACLYTDIGLLTADDIVGADLTELFNFLTGYSKPVRYRRLVAAPSSLREQVVELIRSEAEAGADGRIILKANHLVDPDIIDALYTASAAGASIDLVIRTICALRPGVPGLSDNIRVRSVVGRYLEHSRIFWFGGENDRPVRAYIGSADLWQRNLDRRVEVVVPIMDDDLQVRLRQILDSNLDDDVNAWELDPDGAWHKIPTSDRVSTFHVLQEAALEQARRRRDIPR